MLRYGVDRSVPLVLDGVPDVGFDRVTRRLDIFAKMKLYSIFLFGVQGSQQDLSDRTYTRGEHLLSEDRKSSEVDFIGRLDALLEIDLLL